MNTNFLQKKRYYFDNIKYKYQYYLLYKFEINLQYKQILEGSGEVCKESDTPIISYIGKYLNGEVFGKSSQDESELNANESNVAKLIQQ